MYYITNHKIIRTKHGEYITVITKDYDMINLNIDKNIESYDKSYNLTKNIYRKIRNFKKKFIIHDDKKQLLANINNI
jgi:hypothetical protein